MNSFDLKSYLQRINYNGVTSPSLAVLNALTQAHTQSIAFENVDVVLNKPILLTDDGIFQKLVTNQRGGYCFEQNGLFLQALTHLGFEAKPLSARVRLRFTDRMQQAPRTHMFVRVELNGESHLTDVGMGAASLTCALKLETGVEQETPHDFRRIDKVRNIWYHQIRYGEVWQDACEFTLEEMPLIDREVANWYTSAHPQSHFKGHIMVARALPTGQRLTLQDYDLNRREKNGEVQKTKLNGNKELIETLTKEFGLKLSEADREKISIFCP